MSPTTAAKSESLTKLPASELAALIAGGEVSSVEVVEAHIERIEQVNPALNAVVFKCYESARAEARAADRRRAEGLPLGPLHGVPVTIKESFELRHTPATFGLPSRAGVMGRQDEPHVARLRSAGAIILGKTNVSQLLLYYESDNPLYGRANNPWDLERSCGGSSGGEGAIVAAGGSPLGLGNDLGGSARIPAAFCGVAALKPTAGRTPDISRYSIPYGQQAIVSQVSPLARQVKDVALALEVINGGRNPEVEPPAPLGDPAGVDMSRLRVAYYSDDSSFQVAPAVRRAVEEAAAMLRQAGAEVRPWQPPDIELALSLFFGILGADGGRGLRIALGPDKADPRVTALLFVARRSGLTLALASRLLEFLGQPSLAKFIRYFGRHDTHHYWQMVEALLDYRRHFLENLDRAQGGPIDLILCPACALPAFTHMSSRELGLAGAYAMLYNLLGYPAGVVPVTRVRPEEEVGRAPSKDRVEQIARKVEQGSAGLPVAVQVVARPWREHVALAAMQAIETAARTRPDYPAFPPV